MHAFRENRTPRQMGKIKYVKFLGCYKFGNTIKLRALKHDLFTHLEGVHYILYNVLNA